MAYVHAAAYLTPDAASFLTPCRGYILTIRYEFIVSNDACNSSRSDCERLDEVKGWENVISRLKYRFLRDP